MKLGNWCTQFKKSISLIWFQLISAKAKQWLTILATKDLADPEEADIAAIASEDDPLPVPGGLAPMLVLGNQEVFEALNGSHHRGNWQVGAKKGQLATKGKLKIANLGQ